MAFPHLFLGKKKPGWGPQIFSDTKNRIRFCQDQAIKGYEESCWLVV